tara:strand:+ start:340 stop:726 length:387 start_codon:yes stop_codon:yes gene_type:complete
MSKAAELAEFGGGISNGPNAVEGLAKAWVRITGTGSPYASAKSFNTSSVTDNANGDVTQTLTSAMSDALSNVHASGVKDATTGTAICGPFTITTTTNRATQGYINSTGGTLTLYDYPGFAISQFGDLA